MTRSQRLAFRLSVVFLVLTGMLWTMTTHGVPTAQAATGTTFYGVNATLMNNAIAKIWPQKTGPYCGIATAMGLANYLAEQSGAAMPFTSQTEQVTVARANEQAGASQWGYAKPTNPYGGITNIAPDFGTDPRSIAYDVAHYAPTGTTVHDYIYRWNLYSGNHYTRPSVVTQIQQATTSLARALVTNHQPISVTINAGVHSVLVTGIYVYSSTNPTTVFPAKIASVLYRDPMGGASHDQYNVSFWHWSQGGFSSPYGYYSLWSLYYGVRDPYDPEPTVGPYKPTKVSAYHWFRGFTWIQADKLANVPSPDWAITYAKGSADMTKQMVSP